jgi:hypothetical protein
MPWDVRCNARPRASCPLRTGRLMQPALPRTSLIPSKHVADPLRIGNSTLLGLA